MTTDTPRRLLYTGVSMLLLQAGGMTVAFVLSVVLARSLGVTEFGIYSYALSIATLLAVPVQLGLPTLVVRDTARLKQAGETRQMYRLWSWTTLTVLVVSAAIVLPVWLLAPMVFATSLTLPLLLTVLALVPLMSVGALRAAALRGLGHVIQGQLPEILFRPALILMMVTAVVVLGPDSGPGEGGIQAQGALLVNLIATGVAFIAGLIMLRHVAPAPDTSAATRPPHRDWIRAGMILGIASSAMVVNRNLDMVMLGGMRPAAEAGIYKVAVTLAMLGATALNVLNIAAQPRIAQMHARGDLDGMRRLVTFVARIGFGTGCIVALVFAMLGHWMIGTAFGTAYTKAYPAMMVLVAGQLANTFFGPVMMVLNMSGKERQVMYGVVLAAVGNFVLNALLIPRFGIIGAAGASAFTLLAWNLLLAFTALRRMGIDCSALGLHPKGFTT